MLDAPTTPFNLMFSKLNYDTFFFSKYTYAFIAEKQSMRTIVIRRQREIFETAQV